MFSDVCVCVCVTLPAVVALVWPDAFTQVAPPSLTHAAASVLTRALVTLVSVAASHGDVRLDVRTFGRRPRHHQLRVHQHVSEAAQEAPWALSSVPTPAAASYEETLAGGSWIRDGVGLLAQLDLSSRESGAVLSRADQPDEAGHAAQ